MCWNRTHSSSSYSCKFVVAFKYPCKFMKMVRPSHGPSNTTGPMIYTPMGIKIFTSQVAEHPTFHIDINACISKNAKVGTSLHASKKRIWSRLVVTYRPVYRRSFHCRLHRNFEHCMNYFGSWQRQARKNNALPMWKEEAPSSSSSSSPLPPVALNLSPRKRKVEINLRREQSIWEKNGI